MSTEQPHDSLFRLVFSDLAVAREHLAEHLPPEIASQARWDTLRLEDVTFVDEDLETGQADLLFSVELRSRRRAYVYVLFEHLSSPERRMSLRMVGYVLRIYDGLEEPLPQVVPLVLYTGAQRWTQPVAVEELVSGRFVPRFRFVLFDLGRAADEALGPPGVRRSVLLVMKYGRARDLWRRFVGWLPDLLDVLRGPEGPRMFRAMWSYLRRVSRREPPPDVFTALEVTLGSEIRREAEGWGTRQERLAREQGLEQGRRELLMEQLGARFGPLLPDTESRLLVLGPEQLRRLATRILTATSLADVFADE